MQPAQRSEDNTLAVKRLLTIGLILIGLALAAGLAPGQQLSKRLILKDGSYQLATKWEVKGDRVRYLSAERGEWEEVPSSMVDWAATDSYEKERSAGKPVPEAGALDKELEAERKADEVRSPHVAPGLQLPEDGGILLLDTFQSQPQLLELEQSGGAVNKNVKGNILRAAINPVASSKLIVELPGMHAAVQAHATVPAIYINLDQQDAASDMPVKKQDPDLPWDHYRIVHLEQNKKKKTRVLGDIKVAVYGKVSQEEKFVPTTASKLTGGWIKVTPIEALTPGEYAVLEMLGKEGMNLYVWDFGIDPNAPANAKAWKPDPTATAPPPDKPKDLEQRQ
jgi:hypothetical protein